MVYLFTNELNVKPFPLILCIIAKKNKPDKMPGVSKELKGISKSKMQNERNFSPFTNCKTANNVKIAITKNLGWVAIGS